MVAPPPNPSTTSNLLSTQSSLIQTLCSFLTVSIHHILYLRSIYPRASFLSTRAYNFPARQNRHPAVCGWINSAIDAVRDQLEKNTVEKIALCIFDLERNVVLEKWTFDLATFPLVEKLDRDTPFEREGGEDNLSAINLKERINIADLEAQFRAVLSRLTSASARLTDLPKQKECSFTVSIEVRDDADRPVGRLEKEERKWVAAEPKPWNPAVEPQEGLSAEGQEEESMAPTRKRHGKTVPVRRLEAGELRMEVWVEESKEKFIQESISSAES
jgi:mitotic spindle assembly checkpoint protein MAD2B